MKLNQLLLNVFCCIFLSGCFGNNGIRYYRVQSNYHVKSCLCVVGKMTKKKMRNFPSPSVNSNMYMQFQLYDDLCILGRYINVKVNTTGNPFNFFPEVGYDYYVYYTEDPLQIVGISTVGEKPVTLLELDNVSVLMQACERYKEMQHARDTK